jgi:hypothetical protein
VAEAYTVSLWGVGMSHVIREIAEAETVTAVEGHMRGAAIMLQRSPRNLRERIGQVKAD